MQHSKRKFKINIITLSSLISITRYVLELRNSWLYLPVPTQFGKHVVVETTKDSIHLVSFFKNFRILRCRPHVFPFYFQTVVCKIPAQLSPFEKKKLRKYNTCVPFKTKIGSTRHVSKTIGSEKTQRVPK